MIWFVASMLWISTAWASSEPKLKSVTDMDFENTNVQKVCLLAQFESKIVIHQSLAPGGVKSHTLEIPDNWTTDGSFCNKNYVTLLQLNFAGSTIQMKFKRNVPATQEHETNYCDHCNYGSWTMEQMTYHIVHAGLKIHGTSEAADIANRAPELSDGIGIKRSFTCDKTDKVIEFPIRVAEVVNVTNNKTSKDNWSAKITFDMLRVQPFLVVGEHSSVHHKQRFSDPYLCRDVAVSHFLIIFMPLVFFTIYIAFYRIKHAYGCPPKCDSSGMILEKISSTQMEMEESTNVLSDDYSTVHFGQTSTTCEE